MNYFLLIIVAVAGIVLGSYFARRNVHKQASAGPGGPLTRQSEEKARNKEKIMEFVRTHEKTANNDVEKLLGVSDASATRYLDELEEEGKIRQIGTTGRHVYYMPAK